MSVTIPSQTTLSAAVTRLGRTVAVASATGAVAGGFIVMGNEIALIQAVNGLVLTVERGQAGTAARPHASGTAVWLSSAASTFVTEGFGGLETRVALAGDIDDPVAQAYPLPFGSEIVDPNTGYVYESVRSGAAITAGQWVVMDGAGVAALLTAALKGRCGIAVETVTAAGVALRVLRVGDSAIANMDAGVVTTAPMQAGGTAGRAFTSDDAGGNVIHKATATAAPVSNVGSARLDRPFVYGLTNSIVPAGS